jgi:hypothetical protein
MVNNYRSRISGGYVTGSDINRNNTAIQKRMELPITRNLRRVSGQRSRKLIDIPKVNPYYFARYSNNIKAEPMKYARGLMRSKAMQPAARLSRWKDIRIGTQKQKITSFAKKGLGTAAGIGLGVGAIGFGISYGLAAMSRASKKAPVVHTGAIRNTGQTNQYFNMGADPFGGVRFASKKRNF